MMCRKFLGIFALITSIISILAGCAPKPQVEIYMEPVAGRKGAEIIHRPALPRGQRGVQITLEPLDEGRFI